MSIIKKIRGRGVEGISHTVSEKSPDLKAKPRMTILILGKTLTIGSSGLSINLVGPIVLIGIIPFI